MNTSKYFILITIYDQDSLFQNVAYFKIYHRIVLSTSCLLNLTEAARYVELIEIFEGFITYTIKVMFEVTQQLSNHMISVVVILIFS